MIHKLSPRFIPLQHPPLGDVDELEAVPTLHGVTGVLGVQVPGERPAITIGQVTPTIERPMKRGI